MRRSLRGVLDAHGSSLPSQFSFPEFVGLLCPRFHLCIASGFRCRIFPLLPATESWKRDSLGFRLILRNWNLFYLDCGRLTRFHALNPPRAQQDMGLKRVPR